MRVVDEPMETLHLYVVPENQLPPNGDHLAIFMMIFCSLFLIGIIVLSVLVPAPDHNVEFPLAIEGYSLPPVSKTVKITTIATGKQYVPTYGQTSVPAHAVAPGSLGNIQAGDINEACCVTSVIAQNASFHGGRDAYTYTYLSDKDVKNTTAPLLPTLQVQTLSMLPNPQLNPTCTTITTSSPGVGKETTNAVLRITETCKAFSYTIASVKDAISVYSRHFGTGTLTHVQFSVVGITVKKRVAISLFVTAKWNPIVVRRFSTGK